MAGDATLFQRSDMVEPDGTVIQPILDVWHALPARGSRTMRQARGVLSEADDLLERDGPLVRRIGEEEVDNRGRDCRPG